MQGLSIILPAFNEATYLRATLDSLKQSSAFLLRDQGMSAEIIVVDNNSTDSTAYVACDLGAKVVNESDHNIARVRNTGARHSQADIMVFVDADTVVPAELLSRIVDVLADTRCLGGVVDMNHQPNKPIVRAYLQFWRIIGKLFGMAQGATQFYRKDVFFKLNGYDETLFMGEDVDLFWRLRRLARQRRGRVAFIDDLKVTPSPRRFDQWPVWRTLVWTNPVIILLLIRSKKFWRSWYEEAPR